MKIISQHFDDESIKKATVSIDDNMYYVSIYYKDELLRVKPFVSEENAENYAEDWVIVNE
jgi:hypothetical protein